MSNDKLAEALREADELLCDFQTNFGVLPPDDEDDRAAWERIEKCRKTLAAHAAEAAQAQSGDMVTFVHRVLEHFPIDANGYFLPLSANRLAFAIEKSHAAAPQQAADPVAWLIEYDCNPATAIATTSIAVVDGLRGNRNRITPLYTHPQSAQDAKDAARYRFAQTHDGFAVCRWDEAAGPERDGEYIPIDDEDVDAAMAKESGR